ncbi:GLPGLI family protein [Chryseobacterium sp.]|uniref:GLPGLI family protein n=1 Tax=Chryseobacterium sp. TaxID=1871047 RepID=UPI00289CBD07|nr:GLPGLI family protein [Chryseobacterium sp.]
MYSIIKIFCLLVFLLFFNFFDSQSTIVEYQFKTIQDTKRELLIYNKESAFYFDYVKEDNLMAKEILDNYDISKGGQKMFRNLTNPNSIKLIKAFPKTREQCIINDEKYKIDWKLGNEKQNILGFSCHNAIGEFRGRRYVVWFTYQIPVSLGPWKLDGLPGLILKVEDKDGVNGYEATQIINQSTNGIPKSVYAFMDDYDKTKIILYKNYIDKENDYLKAIQQQSLAYIPKGVTNYTVPYFRSAMREYNFEWNNFEPQKP